MLHIAAATQARFDTEGRTYYRRKVRHEALDVRAGVEDGPLRRSAHWANAR